MSRHGLTGIGQAIKANTTEKSIDELRAEGKKKVRVVSSERVMAIIQAIVDDTIASEVGEITQRDRDRIVSDTTARFSHVLKMQQDSEEAIQELRTSLSNAELERDRLRNDKNLLETQLEAARKVDGEADDLERVSRDVARVRDTVERMAQSSANAVDEVALGRLAEKLAAQDAQTARRHSAELDDLRERMGHVVRDLAASRDAAIETSFQRSRDLQAESDAPIDARLDRDLRAFTEHLAEIREKVGRAPAAEEAVTRLRGNLEAIEKRLQGVEKSSSDLAARISETVLTRIEEREAKATASRSDAIAAQTAALAEALRRMHHATGEGMQNVLKEIGTLRESSDDAQTASMSVRAEQFRDLERRISAAVTDSVAGVAKNADQSAARTAALDETLKGLRRDLAAFAERVAAQTAATPTMVNEALGDLRSHAKATAARTTALDESLQGLRGDLAAVSERIAAQSAATPTIVNDALGDVRSHAKATAARTAALDESLHGLRGDLAAFAERIAAQSSTVPAVVTESLGDLRSHAKATAARTAALDESLQGLRGDVAAFAEKIAAQSAATPTIVDEALGDVRSSTKATAARTTALEESLHGLRGDLAAFAERIAAQSAATPALVNEALGDLRSHAKAAADRTDDLDESLKSLRTELADHAATLSATAPPVVTEALADLRSHASASAARTAEVHAELSTRLDGSLADLRGHIETLNARTAETAARQHEAVRALGDVIARSSTAQSDSLQTSFKDALERALDKIERTMQAATARPIEMTGEATEVLLSKIFDDPDSELTSNFDQLDVEQRRSSGSIAKSVGRLKEMGGAKKPGAEQPA